MKLVNALLLSVFSLPLLAQHCPYCMAHIHVLKPTAVGDTVVINGLKITALDSLGNTLFYEDWDENNKLQSYEFRMWQNPGQTTFKGLIDNLNPLQPRKVHFWFAEDNYVTLRFPRESFWLLIEDIDGPENGGEFESKKIRVWDLMPYPLCTSMSSWRRSPGYRSFVEGYEPVRIEMEEKD